MFGQKTIDEPFINKQNDFKKIFVRNISMHV